MNVPAPAPVPAPKPADKLDQIEKEMTEVIRRWIVCKFREEIDATQKSIKPQVVCDVEELINIITNYSLEDMLKMSTAAINGIKTVMLTLPEDKSLVRLTFDPKTSNVMTFDVTPPKH